MELTKEIAEYVAEFGGEYITEREFKRRIGMIGYKYDDRCTFIYRNITNRKKYDGKAVYIVERDTGLSYSHYRARNDDRFEELFELIFNGPVVVTNNGRRIVEA